MTQHVQPARPDRFVINDAGLCMSLRIPSLTLLARDLEFARSLQVWMRTENVPELGLLFGPPIRLTLPSSRLWRDQMLAHAKIATCRRNLFAVRCSQTSTSSSVAILEVFGICMFGQFRRNTWPHDQDECRRLTFRPSFRS